MEHTAIYTRVSTTEQSENGHSLDAQRSQCEGYVAAMGQEWQPPVTYTDAGVSGSLPPTERPALAEALDALAGGEAKALVTSSLSRLGRSALDVLTIAQLAKDQGWHLVILDLGIDTRTPVGHLALTLLAGVAELEREQLRERTRQGLAEARAKGQRLGAPVSEATLKAGERASALRADGLTWQAVADTLGSEGYLTAKGMSRWSPSQAQRAERSLTLTAQADALAAEAR